MEILLSLQQASVEGAWLQCIDPALGREVPRGERHCLPHWNRDPQPEEPAALYCQGLGTLGAVYEGSGWRQRLGNGYCLPITNH